MTQHTEGPWKAERIGEGAGREKGLAFRILGNTGRRQWSELAVTYYKPMFEEVQANARLIAAAPDMLDDHRANRDDASAVVCALAEDRVLDARLLMAAISRRSEAVIAKAESAE